MSSKEIGRIDILEKLARRELKQKVGAELLGVSVRQIKRLVKKYKRDGAQSLIHKARGKVSNNKIAPEIIDQAIKLVKDNYSDFGPTLAGEKLAENHGITLSSERIRQEMILVGLWKPHRRRKASVHQLRERRACSGELVQMDGSPHDWFEGRGPKCNLNVIIDDATGVPFLRLSDVESTQGYFEIAQHYFLERGLPVAIYVDKHSIFRVNIATNLDFKKPGKNTYEGLTQFGRAMVELGITLIFANSPQAKGRVERINQTLQDRLVKELRLRNISTIDEANAFLPEFTAKFITKFAVKPTSNLDMHQKIHPSIDLTKILCIKETRTLSKNLTFQYDSTIFQVKTTKSAYTLRKTDVTICFRYDGTISIYSYKNEPLEFTTIKKVPNTSETSSKQLAKAVDDILILNKQKRNQWESSQQELSQNTLFYKPLGAV